MKNAISEPFEWTDQRHAARTHLFVIATLCWGAGTSPVHVRNMSARGALIEGAALPRPGSLVVLKRGSLEVSGRVAWAAERQAGLAFGTLVNVADWMARRANAHQDRIDEIVSQLKAQELPEEDAMSVNHPPAPRDQLERLRSDLVQLGDALTADVILIATHPEIQLIDIALQRVDRIIAALAPEGSTKL